MLLMWAYLRSSHVPRSLWSRTRQEECYPIYQDDAQVRTLRLSKTSQHGNTAEQHSARTDKKARLMSGPSKALSSR